MEVVVLFMHQWF